MRPARLKKEDGDRDREDELEQGGRIEADVPADDISSGERGGGGERDGRRAKLGHHVRSVTRHAVTAARPCRNSLLMTP
jgi:hypothetical protein